MLRKLLAAVGLLPEEVPGDSRRSGHWPTVRAAWLKAHPACAACGSTKHVEVHHKIPVDWDPSLELDERNFQTLCRSPGRQCHLHEGHLGTYHSFNENCEEDAARSLAAIQGRPTRAGNYQAALQRLRKKLRA